MEWHDDAIILGLRQHGETSAIVEVMTPLHGRHLGVVKGGRSKRMQPMLQPGNKMRVQWWARLNEHMGSFRVETLDFSAARLIDLPLALYGLQTVSAHLRLLPERDPHVGLYEALQLLLSYADDPLMLAEILLRFELRLLEDVGFGLDLLSCAATGKKENLIYVSPKSARAVCGEAGLPWHDKLLLLPEFLCSLQKRPSKLSDFKSGFALTGYFLTRHVWEPRGIAPPIVREKFQIHLQRFFEKQSLTVV